MFSNNSSESACHDCSASTNGWISTNRGVFLCDECTSIHLTLGRQISSIGHINNLNPKVVKLVRSLSSNGSNEIWEFNLKSKAENSTKNALSSNLGFRKPVPNDSSEIKKGFIVAKYKSMIFSAQLSSSDKTDKLNQVFIETVKTGNTLKTLKLASLGADINQIRIEDRCNTALHYAVENNQPLQIELLLLLGANPLLKNSSGMTPYECAEANNNVELKQRILELTYEVFNKFSCFLFNELPNHSNGYHYILPIMNEKDIERDQRVRLFENLSEKQLEEICADIYDEIDRVFILQILREQSTVKYDILGHLPELNSYSRNRNQFRVMLAKLSRTALTYLVSDLIEALRLKEISSTSMEITNHSKKSLFNNNSSLQSKSDCSTVLSNKEQNMDDVMKSLNSIEASHVNSNQTKVNRYSMRVGNNSQQGYIMANQRIKMTKSIATNTQHIYDNLQYDYITNTYATDNNSFSSNKNIQNRNRIPSHKETNQDNDYDVITNYSNASKKTAKPQENEYDFLPSTTKIPNQQNITQQNIVNKDKDNDYDILPSNTKTSNTAEDEFKNDHLTSTSNSHVPSANINDADYDNVTLIGNSNIEKNKVIQHKIILEKQKNPLKSNKDLPNQPTYDDINDNSTYDTIENIQKNSQGCNSDANKNENESPSPSPISNKMNSSNSTTETNNTIKMDTVKVIIQSFVECSVQNNEENLMLGLNDLTNILNQVQNNCKIHENKPSYRAINQIFLAIKQTIQLMKDSILKKNKNNSNTEQIENTKSDRNNNVKEVVVQSLELAKKFKEVFIVMKKMESELIENY